MSSSFPFTPLVMETQKKEVRGRGSKRKEDGCHTINGRGKRPKYTDGPTVYKVSPDGEVLTIYLLHPPVRTKPPSLKDMEKIALEGHNYLPGKVKGKSCRVFVDTGTTDNVIEDSHAK